MSLREDAKAKRRRAILEAAKELMGSSQERSFSMRNLADLANVSIATPYNLFGSKQAILLAVLGEGQVRFEQALEALDGDEIEILFQAPTLIAAGYVENPDYHRSLISAVYQNGGPDTYFNASISPFRLWKKLLGRATEAGLLSPHVDADIFAATFGQLLLSHIVQWAHGLISLDEMEAHVHFGTSLILQAIATEKSLDRLLLKMKDAEKELRSHWKAGLNERLQRGDLDGETRTLLADKLEMTDIKEAS